MATTKYHLSSAPFSFDKPTPEMMRHEFEIAQKLFAGSNVMGPIFIDLHEEPFYNNAWSLYVTALGVE